MQHRLIAHHRGFLKSLKVDGINKFKDKCKYDDQAQVLFSIEVDGKRKTYDFLFTNIKVISSLEDNELLALCKKLINIKSIVGIWLLCCFIASIAIFYVG